MNRHLKMFLVILMLAGVVAGVTWTRHAYIGGDGFKRRFLQHVAQGGPDYAEVKQVARLMLLPDPELSSRDVQLAVLGRKLFFDAGLSSNGHISCAHCHNPEKSFTDGLPTSIGLAPTDRNAPSVVNTFNNFWFFWDGRADSLAAQALGPLENAKEHGLTRTEIVRHVAMHYRDDYEKLFGSIPEVFLAALPEKAKPLLPPLLPSHRVAKIAATSLSSPEMIRRFVGIENERGGDGRSFFQAEDMIDPVEFAAAEAYDALAPVFRMTLDQVFANVGLAIEAYEKGLVANQSPFDRFAQTWNAGESSDPGEYFNEAFSGKELLGLQIFLGKGGCNFCHTGANLTDSQFHSIGLPQLGQEVSLGRSVGVLKVLQDPFSCSAAFADIVERQKSESCRDLPYLDSESPEAIGAFKTPSLRNVSLTAPYMHDGRMTSLRQVLEHYNVMDTLSAVGFREETLKPLGLSEEELSALEAFLLSLSSPVRDITATMTPSH